MDVEGRKVLVTGASSGIGREIARAFAGAGSGLVLVARRERRLEELRDELRDEYGVPVAVVAADLGEPGAVRRVVEAAGTVDVLVNNAGSEAGGSVWSVGDRPEARAMFEVDFWAPLALIAALVPAMRERGSGAVVNMTSIRQVLAWPSLGHSAAAKAGLAQVTETLRLELQGSGVAVVEAVAGPVETAALAVSRLLPGFVEELDHIFGTGTPAGMAEQVLQAVRLEQERVFYPASVEPAYERPVELRATIARAVRQAPPLPDGLVVGPGNALLTATRDDWERAR